MVEDLFLALHLAALAPVLGDAQSVGAAVLLFARAAGFLIALGLVARYASQAVSRVIATHDDELLIVNITAQQSQEALEAELADAEADLGIEHDEPEAATDEAAGEPASEDEAGAASDG